MKYTREFLLPYVQRSISYSEVCRLIGIQPTGGSASYLARRIKMLKIDTSHFLGARAMSHPKYYYKFKRKTPDEILVVRTPEQGRAPARLLTRALVETGIKYECSICGQEPVWNKKPLTFHVDHIDGDSLNNTSDNLRFLCPNCHTQTDSYARPKTSKSTKSKPYNSRTAAAMNISINNNEKYCTCGKPISPKAFRCKSCAVKYNTNRQKIEWPATQVLQKMVDETSYSNVARQLGVSDNSVRKRLKNH